MEDSYPKKTDTIQLRIDSLKSNRVFITAIFTIISAISTIIFNNFTGNFINFGITITWLLLTLLCMLYSMFTITDSIHFYTKHLEYSYCWMNEVHGEAYGIDNKECKAISDYQRALEADDVGYFYMKYSILFFTFFISSIFIHLLSNYIYVNYEIRFNYIILSIITYTLLLSINVITYGWIHKKKFVRALHDFLWRNPVFENIRECKKTE